MDDRKPLNQMSEDEMRDELLQQQLGIISRMDETTMKHHLVSARTQAYLTRQMEEAGMQAPVTATPEQGPFF